MGFCLGLSSDQRVRAWTETPEGIRTEAYLFSVNYEDPRVLRQYQGQPLRVSARETAEIVLQVIERNR